MRIELIDEKDFAFNKPTKWKTILDEFANSDKNIAKLVFADKEYSSVETAAGCAYQAIKRYKKNMYVIRRDGIVYIVKNK